MADPLAGEKPVEHSSSLEGPVIELVGDLVLVLFTNFLGWGRLFLDETNPAFGAFLDLLDVLTRTLEAIHG